MAEKKYIFQPDNMLQVTIPKEEIGAFLLVLEFIGDLQRKSAKNTCTFINNISDSCIHVTIANHTLDFPANDLCEYLNNNY